MQFLDGLPDSLNAYDICDVTDKALIGKVLLKACFDGNLLILKKLFDLGLSKDVTVRSYGTPLHVVSWYGHHDLVDYLLGLGVEVNCLDPVGASPLYCALRTDQVSVAKTLVTFGADIEHIKEDYAEYYDMLSVFREREIVKGAASSCDNSEGSIGL